MLLVVLSAYVGKFMAFQMGYLLQQHLDGISLAALNPKP